MARPFLPLFVHPSGSIELGGLRVIVSDRGWPRAAVLEGPENNDRGRMAFYIPFEFEQDMQMPRDKAGVEFCHFGAVRDALERAGDVSLSGPVTRGPNPPDLIVHRDAAIGVELAQFTSASRRNALGMLATLRASILGSAPDRFARLRNRLVLVSFDDPRGRPPKRQDGVALEEILAQMDRIDPGPEVDDVDELVDRSGFGVRITNTPLGSGQVGCFPLPMIPDSRLGRERGFELAASLTITLRSSDIEDELRRLVHNHDHPANSVLVISAGAPRNGVCLIAEEIATEHRVLSQIAILPPKYLRRVILHRWSYDDVYELFPSQRALAKTTIEDPGGVLIVPAREISSSSFAERCFCGGDKTFAECHGVAATALQSRAPGTSSDGDAILRSSSVEVPDRISLHVPIGDRGTSNVFASTPSLYARSIVEHAGKPFVVEVKFGVACVRENAGVSPPQFDVEYRVASVVQPASAVSPLTHAPTSFAPQCSAIVRAGDGLSYETVLDCEVTETRLHPPYDLLTDMPQASATITCRGTAPKLVEQVPSSLFVCAYCGHDHPRSFRSEEHIVPRALLSPSYVLKGVCNTLNNYFSHAFEKRCLKLPVIEELLLMFNPRKKAVFRGSVPTTDGREVTRWVRDGVTELREQPQYSETKACTVSIITATGEKIRITIQLPFGIVGSVRGHPSLLAEDDRRVERDRLRVAEYLRVLEADPSQNADLANALKEHNASFVSPSNVRMDRVPSQAASPPELASESVPLWGDDELLTKLLYKIAWTHAARQLGRHSLMASTFARGMIEFLRSEHIVDSSAAKRTPGLFTKPATIHGVEYIFWKDDLPTSEHTVSTVVDAVQREHLERLLAYRKTRAAFIRPYVDIEPIPLLDDELRASLPGRRFHELSLRTISPNSTSFTACQVSLFGGIIRATVPLSEEPLADVYPEPTLIRF